MTRRRLSKKLVSGPLSEREKYYMKSWGMTPSEFRKTLNESPKPCRTPEEIAAALQRAEAEVDRMRDQIELDKIEERRRAREAAAAERARRLQDEMNDENCDEPHT